MSKLPPDIIRHLETKMLPSKTGRDVTESPKVALTRAEQLIYADYLLSINQPLGSEFFRRDDDYGLNLRKEKIKTRKKK